MSNIFTVYAGSEGQVLSDQLMKDGRPMVLDPAATVKFYLRYAVSDVLKINGTAADIDDFDKGLVSYSWTDANLDTPGEYKGWWKIVQPDTTNIDTAEFVVIISQHAPGVRTQTGPVYRKARGIIPVTWSALEEWEKYGDALLQEHIEVIKTKIFGVAVAVDDEYDLDIRVQQYLAKLAVIGVIPTGIDYWLNQKTSVSATGTNENVSFPDRIEALKDIHKQLVGEIVADRAEIEDIIDLPTVNTDIAVPAFSPGTTDGFKTPIAGEDFFDYSFGERMKFW